jgi:hypothetical protein
VNETGSRVFDLRGRVAHDVGSTELAMLTTVPINGHSATVVAFAFEPRKPKQGRIRRRRGAKDDDGCMPDTYGRNAEEVLMLLSERWEAARGPVPMPAVTSSDLALS